MKPVSKQTETEFISLVLKCKDSLLKLVSNCTDMVLFSSVQVSQESGEMALKDVTNMAQNKLLARSNFQKRPQQLKQHFLLSSVSKASYRNYFPSINIPRSSVPMCYIVNLKDLLKQNRDS